MSREKKYRVISNRKTYYWGFIDGCFVAPTFGGELSVSKVNELSCEFTGLYDKAGTPIYEGDMVKDYQGRISNIYYDNGRWNLKLIKGDIHGAKYLDCHWMDFEVIGNIYESPTKEG